MDRYQCLAELLLDGLWNLESIEEVIARFSGTRSKARKRLGAEVFIKFQARPARNKLIAFIKKREDELCAKLRWDQIESARRFEVGPSRMRDRIVAPFAKSVPEFGSVGAFAEWCAIPAGLVEWLSLHRKEHYRMRAIPKRSGGIRILESPRARLKSLQRTIVARLLNFIPVHSSAHGFVRGRSILSYAQPHCGKQVVLRMDLQDFFPSIDAARVFGLFRSLGYPHPVTQLLTNLCTACLSEDQIESVANEHLRFRPHSETVSLLRRIYCRKHLPQGAPSSPYLANLVAYNLDSRLAGLASNAGLSYTRYADDLLFSGDHAFGRFAKSFAIKVGSIVMDEGFQIQFRKTRIMRASTQQRVAGMVINRRTNICREEYDRLKAVLFNCARFGPAEQNRDSVPNFREHIRGRIHWVRQLHSIRGDKLMKIFLAIDWTST